MYPDHYWNRQQRKRFLLVSLSVIMILSCVTTFLHAEEGIEKSRVQRSIVKQLRYIDANKAKEYLVSLGIGTDINKLGSMNALIITVDNDLDKAKASALIGLIDSKTSFELIRLKVDLIPDRIDDISTIQSKIEGILLGTFRNPPSGTASVRAIIDVHGSDLIALVPKRYAPPIVAILEDMYRSKADMIQSPKTATPDIDIQQPDAVLSMPIEPENESIPEDDAGSENDFVNSQLPEALSNIEQESASPSVTEKSTKKIAAAPALFAKQMVVTGTNNRPIAAKPQTRPAPAMLAENEGAKKQPSMAELMKTIAQMTSGAPPAEITKPAKNTEPVKHSEPVTRSTHAARSEQPASGKYDGDFSETELETTINLPTKVQVVKLLELVGEQLNLNYMYDPTQITGDITLYINDGKIRVGELYSLLENVLQFKGFVMTRRGKFVTIVRSNDISRIDPKIVLPGEKLETGNVVVTQIFQLEHISTATANKMLDSMKLGLSVQDIPQMKSLIITGYASRMERISEVLKMVDQPGNKKLYQFRYLKYTTASDLVTKIQILAKQLGTVSITIGSKAAPAPTPASTRGKSASQRAAAARAAAAAAKRNAAASASKTSIGPAADAGSVYLGIDNRTNRILMIGMAEAIDIVSSLIDSLDIPQAGLKEVRQYNILNVEAEYMIDILSELGATSISARPAAPVPVKPGSKAPRSTPTTRGASSGKGPQISLLEESNSLLINASPEEHDRIAVIIKYVDVVKEELRTINEYVLENVDASEIVETLLELGIISTLPGSSGSSRRFGSTSSSSRGSKTPTASRSVTPSASKASSSSDPISGEPMIAILEAANSLLVNATIEQHEKIAMIIAHVDRNPSDNAMPYVIYALTSQTAIDLKPILDEVINAKQATTPIKSSSTSKTPGIAAVSKIQSASSGSGSVISDRERIEIVADENTNSLIVYASKKNQTWIGRLIEELDEYRPQVLLDVTLVEITKDNEFNFDLDLISKYGGLNPGEAMTTITKAGLTGISELAAFGTKATEGSISSGFGRAFYADNHIQALLGIMDKKGYGRVLARPSILVKDNEQGVIKTEKTRYVAEEKTQTTYTGTGAGNQNTSINVDFKPYASGITLTITPHISSKQLLQLEIELDRNDFDKSSGATVTLSSGASVPKPYDEINSNLNTWAILPDGATIILGGIETINQSKTIKKVPLLGDIPIIGALFRGIDESDIQSKLYVFVKAHIINPGDELTGNSDIERISLKKRYLFEEDEKKFQSLQAVPGIKPKPIQPPKILEEDDYLTEIRARRGRSQQVGGDVSIDVVTPAAPQDDEAVDYDYDDYLRLLRDEKNRELEEAALRGVDPDASALEIQFDGNGHVKKRRTRKLVGSTTRVEVILPD